jgi:hypothetical protein
MPADDGFWFDDQQDVGRAGPDAAKRGPKQSIARIQGWPRSLALQYGDLLAKSQDLKRNIIPAAKENSERGKESEDELEHGVTQP